jgi:hypothetical protein
VVECQYDSLFPYVYSTLRVKFWVPRSLYSNEELVIDLGKDLNDVNTNSNRFNVALLRDWNNVSLPISVSFRSQRMHVKFSDSSLFY